MTEPEFRVGSDGLTDKDLQTIQNVLDRHPEVRHVTVFGSRAMGSFSQGSDLDLALDGPDLNRRTLARIQSDLAESALPFEVGLLLRNQALDPAVEAHIRMHGYPFGWQKRTISEVTDNFDGKRVPVRETDRRSGPYPYYGASGVVDHVDGFIFDGNYLLVAEDGENLRTRQTPVAFMATGRFWVNNHAHVLRGNGLADTWFLCYAMAHVNVGAYLTGSAMPKLTQGNLNRIELLIPPLQEQRAIASVLKSLDDKIEQNHRTGRKLEALARAMFKAWFVDFEPVKAKAAGATDFPGMPAATFAVLPNQFTNSSLGPVPDRWSVKPLSDVFEVNPPRRLAKGADAPYLDMKNMPTNGHAPDSWERRPLGSGMKFINGDTLVARITPCLENGKTAFVDFLVDHEVGWGSTEYIVLRPKPPLPPIFAYCLSRTEQFREFAIQNMSGTSGRQRVAASAMEHYHIAVPDAVMAGSFGDAVAPLFQYIRAGKTESAKLAVLRNYLLPRLLSGRVRVR